MDIPLHNGDNVQSMGKEANWVLTRPPATSEEFLENEKEGEDKAHHSRFLWQIGVRGSGKKRTEARRKLVHQSRPNHTSQRTSVRNKSSIQMDFSTSRDGRSAKRRNVQDTEGRDTKN